MSGQASQAAYRAFLRHQWLGEKAVYPIMAIATAAGTLGTFAMLRNITTHPNIKLGADRQQIHVDPDEFAKYSDTAVRRGSRHGHKTVFSKLNSALYWRFYAPNGARRAH